MKIVIELEYQGEKTRHGLAVKDELCRDIPREDIADFLKSSIAAAAKYIVNDIHNMDGKLAAYDLPE